MLWKKRGLIVSLALLCSIIGCGNRGIEEKQIVKKDIKEICVDLYEKAMNEGKLTDLETLRSIVSRFGENNYPAVDSKNQIDMVNAEQVLQFCEMVDTRQEAEVTIVEVNDEGFAEYELYTKDGKVDVVRSCYIYENGVLQKKATGCYTAENWNVNEDGYLMFSGIWFSEEQFVLTLSGAVEHTAFRLKPLEETYRVLNRKYILPIGYARNNMFLVDWNEDDFGALDFYDLYDILYSNQTNTYVPYPANDDLGVGNIYQIPKGEFERVVMPYFNMDSSTLQSKTVYDKESSAYEYKPRGFYEVEFPGYPYPEVVGVTENNDGTMKLTVQAVFPDEGIEKVYAHEVVIRTLEDGSVQYVSNRMIPSEHNREITWYTPRLTKEEWEDIYASIIPLFPNIHFIQNG